MMNTTNTNEAFEGAGEVAVPRAKTLFGKPVRHIHCVGVAGMGLGPLAVYLARSGWQVSGEDDSFSACEDTSEAPAALLAKSPGSAASAGAETALSELRERLLEAGVRLEPLPHNYESEDACVNAPVAECTATLVVTSSAVSQSHPTVLAARQLGLPIVRRGELLAEVVKDKKLVAVCGSHGKTTTTAMLASALKSAGFDSGFILGGLPARRGFPLAQVGEVHWEATGALALSAKAAPRPSADWVVAEVDESDGTIKHFAPEITLCVNLDWDHVDHYPSEAALHATFGGLFAKTRRAVLINSDCALSQKLATESATVPVFWFGEQSGGRTDLGGEFWGKRAGETGDSLRLALGVDFEIAEAQVRAKGQFNALNATAALAAAQVMGATLRSDLLANFPGVRRRQTLLSDLGGLRIIEDYAHHPAEIRALQSQTGLFGEPLVGGSSREASQKFVSVFQPHRFSRTAQFKRELAEALSLADHVFLIDVYGAGESPIEGGTTADLLREFAPGKATYCRSDTELFTALDNAAPQAGTLAFIGAGNIDAKARSWVAAWRARFWQNFADEAKTLVSAETKVTREEPLARKTTMLVGGAARVYAEPRNVEELQSVLRFANSRRVPVFPLGRGSNVIVPDEGVEGLVISLNAPEWAKFEVRDLEDEASQPMGADDARPSEARQIKRSVTVSAGLRLKNLCGLATKAGLTGFEFLEGIPGSVGGALRMNAGAMGAWIFDTVDSVEFMTFAGERVTRRADELHVGYRHCAELAEGAIAIGAVLRSGEQVDSEAVARQIDVYRKKRVESQPRDPSAGCIFKNPEGDSAGRLIDSAGLKGLRVGGAEVSTVHANFIVNKAHATASEVLELVAQVRDRVQAAHGVALEPEARLLGKEWEGVLDSFYWASRQRGAQDGASRRALAKLAARQGRGCK